MIAIKEKCVRATASAAFALALFTATAMAQGSERQLNSYQSFYLKNATSQNAANDIQTAMRNLLPGAKIYYAAAENALMVSGSGEELAQAQKMLADLTSRRRFIG